MARKSKYSKEVKIKACKDYGKGDVSFNYIAKEIGTAKEVLRRWYLKYKEHGPGAAASLLDMRFKWVFPTIYI